MKRSCTLQSRNHSVWWAANAKTVHELMFCILSEWRSQPLNVHECAKSLFRRRKQTAGGSPSIAERWMFCVKDDIQTARIITPLKNIVKKKSQFVNPSATSHTNPEDIACYPLPFVVCSLQLLLTFGIFGDRSRIPSEGRYRHLLNVQRKIMTSKKIHFVSLGCPKNRVDSEIMLGLARQEGYQLVEHPEEADLLVVNTCSFIEPARKESVDNILELAEIKEHQGGKKLVVSGCLAQRYPNELQSELPEVDHFLGTGQIPRFAEILQEIQGTPKDLASGAPGWLYTHDSPRMQSTPFYTSYVKIAEGCDRTCAFCAIPSFRGKQKSRPIASIVEEVQELCSRGVREINLIAQELNGYGRDLPKKEDGSRVDLADLLEALEQVEPGPKWIRLMYLYPYGFSERLVQQIASSSRVVPYIDMPLQHISDNVLRSMRRAGNGQDVRKLLASLKEAIPQLTVRTTFLVGFPGETEADFQELYDFLGEQSFDRVGIFRYSPEEGTAAYTYDQPEVPEDVAEERRRLLYERQAELSHKKLARFMDQEIEVLVEGISDESDLLLQGRYAGQAPEIDGVVYINDGVASPGDIVKIKVEQTGEHDLVGGIIEHIEYATPPSPVATSPQPADITSSVDTP